MVVVYFEWQGIKIYEERLYIDYTPQLMLFSFSFALNNSPLSCIN